MTLTADRVSVATSATLLGTSGNDGIDLVVRNEGSETVFLGPSGVTTSAGFALKAGESQSFSLGAGGAIEDLYGIVATGTEELHVLRTNV